MSDLAGGVLYWDCFAGIAGDMAVGALIDLGVPEEVITGAVAAVLKEGYRIEVGEVIRGGMRGRKFRVIVDGEDDHGHGHGHGHDHGHDHAHEHDHGHVHGAHRHWREIRGLIDGAAISDGVKKRAIDIFSRIAEVEARLHGTTLDEVAFHEVGAVDSIVDVVGVAAALDWLRPAKIVSRKVVVGSGMVRAAHGMLPVPAPATLELLRGVPVEDGGIRGEATTPTGAAIVAATAEGFGPFPEMAPVAVGWGAGDREVPDRPNLLRAVVGRAGAGAGAGAGEQAIVVEANIDDLTPELVAPLVEALLAAGARDAWIQPILMKKGRPGFLVAALCDEGRREAVERALLRQSSTIGVRRHAVARTVLPRRMVEVETPFGTVPVKVAEGPDGETNAAPEYEACRAAAERAGVPTKRVWAEALAAYLRR